MTRARRTQLPAPRAREPQLLQPWELALLGPQKSLPESLFTRYRHREGVLALSCAAMAYLMPGIAMLVGAASLGTLGGAVATLLAALVAVWVLDQTGLLGNLDLREELAHKLALDPLQLDFVGVGFPENNRFVAKYLQPRLDSDDNVGFLGLRQGGLTLFTQEGTLLIHREEVRRVSTERLVELPYLFWIRIEYYKSDVLMAVLVSSREAETLWAVRAATEDLHQRLVRWWTEPVTRELLDAA